MELILNNVEKKYGNNPAVSECSAVLREGVYGLLGPNGSGKTTLIRMICSLIKPSSGGIMLNGTSIFQLDEEYRDILGYLPQHFGYYPNFTAHDFLIYISSLKGIPRKIAEENIADLLQLTGLYEERNKKIKTYSGGMKQRLGISQCLLGDPKIILLDEPTAGLDPAERIRFRNIINHLAKDKIIILSTHIVSDVEKLADRILIMKKGKVVYNETEENLLKLIEHKIWKAEIPEDDYSLFSNRYSVIDSRQYGEHVTMRLISEEKPGDNAVLIEPNLEDLYLYLFEEARGIE